MHVFGGAVGGAGHGGGPAGGIVGVLRQGAGRLGDHTRRFAEALGQLAHLQLEGAGDALAFGGQHAVVIGGGLSLGKLETFGFLGAGAQHADRRPQAVDFVAAAAFRDRRVQVALGQAHDRVADLLQRTRDLADGHPQRAAEQHEDAQARGGQEHHGARAAEIVDLGFGGRQIGADDRDHGVDIGLEFLADLAIGVVIALVAGGLRRHFTTQSRGFAAEADKFTRLVVNGGELRQFAGLQIAAPVLEQGLHVVELLVDTIGERLGLGRVRRHVDAARFHDRRRHQPIEMFATISVLIGAMVATNHSVIIGNGKKAQSGNRRGHDSKCGD